MNDIIQTAVKTAQIPKNSAIKPWSKFYMLNQRKIDVLDVTVPDTFAKSYPNFTASEQVAILCHILHWLTVCQTIAVMSHDCLHGTHPAYFTDICIPGWLFTNIVVS